MERPRCHVDTPRRLRQAAVPALALALVLLGTPPASAGPTERLRDFFAAVNTVLGDPETEDKPLERVARIRQLVADISAVSDAAAAALSREWLARSPVEQDEFVDLFAELLERAYVGRLAGRGHVSNGLRISYLGESVAGDEATVQTSLGARDGGEARVDYRMVNRHGLWRVRDLVLDGVSTVENYRAQFRRLLGRISYQELVGQVKAKLDEESIMFGRDEGRTAAAPGPSAVTLRQAVPLDDATTDRDDELPVAPTATTVRSREIGWIVDAATTGTTLSATSYWVQVGAFRTAAAAARLADRLSGGTIVPSASGPLLLVRVGPFAERALAVSRLRDLVAIGYRPFIAEVPD
ncbi:MAG: ABC transporter substrate-binding protein [Candidatus Rokubacteria bacterium]|nr:ABC transporter substrate-binding protein [Candidatus Rokubacteria bacterium]